MASVQFQIHTDKENSSSLGSKMFGANLQSAKGFQAASTQHPKTPRRALGSVNQVDRVTVKPHPPSLDLKASGGKTVGDSTKSSAATLLKPVLVTNKASKGIQQPGSTKDTKLKKRQSQDLEKENKVERVQYKGEKSVASHLSAQSVNITYDDLPDIECIPPPLPPKDDSDDESIWPRKERISTYFTRVLNWRPPCLFGAQPESEDDETTEQHIIMTELDNILLPCEIENNFPFVTMESLQLDEQDLEAVPLPSLDDIDVPQCEVHVVPSSSDLVALDDSLGLSAHLGGLQIKDDSFSSQ